MTTTKANGTDDAPHCSQAPATEKGFYSSPKTQYSLLKKLFFFVFVLWIAYWIFSLGWSYFDSTAHGKKDFWDSIAKFGDSFGALNSLFSGLALAGVIYTLVLQQRELNAMFKANSVAEIFHSLQFAHHHLLSLTSRIMMTNTTPSEPYFLVAYDENELKIELRNKLKSRASILEHNLGCDRCDLKLIADALAKLQLLEQKDINYSALLEYTKRYIHRFLFLFSWHAELVGSKCNRDVEPEKVSPIDEEALEKAATNLYMLLNFFRPVKNNVIATLELLTANREHFSLDELHFHAIRILHSFPLDFLTLSGCDVWWNDEEVKSDIVKSHVQEALECLAHNEFFGSQNQQLEDAYRYFVKESLTSGINHSSYTRFLLRNAVDIYNGREVKNPI